MTESWGHAEHARYGGVELELDEAIDADELALTVTFPSVQLRFTIPDVGVIEALSKFLRDHYGQTTGGELAVGTLDGLIVRLGKDDEHPDRFFLNTSASGMMSITIVDPVAADFVRAAEELVASMNAR